jgi:alkylated DNA repair dioxygenase AlkB
MKDLNSLGLLLVENFLTDNEEAEIVSKIPETKILKNSGRNSIRRYGSNIPYKNQMESVDIPDYLDFIAEKIVKSGLLFVKPNSISINEYIKGNFIPHHIDSQQNGPIITIVSLLSDAIMEFAYKNNTEKIIIPRLSLIQLKDEIRHKWTHSILPVQNKRYSIVFRNS